MATYTVRMSDEQSVEYETFDAPDPDEAAERATERTEAWVRKGDWGDDGAVIAARWVLFADADPAADGVGPLDDGHLTVEIEPDHEALMAAAGAPDDCDHDFVSTVAVDGGNRENPGVWSLGGTTMCYRSHCRHCGLGKRVVRYGYQRDPGRADKVEYEMPEDVARDGDA